jgi:PKHD-type hydroxylase
MLAIDCGLHAASETGVGGEHGSDSVCEHPQVIGGVRVPERLDELGVRALGKAIREINDALYGFVVSQFKEGFQLTRYEVGDYYGPHFDIGPGRLTERKLSLTVQLSAPEDYTGGELVIYPEFVASKDRER